MDNIAHAQHMAKMAREGAEIHRSYREFATGPLLAWAEAVAAARDAEAEAYEAYVAALSGSAVPA